MKMRGAVKKYFERTHFKQIRTNYFNDIKHKTQLGSSVLSKRTVSGFNEERRGIEKLYD
jgi:hypothetical protein